MLNQLCFLIVLSTSVSVNAESFENSRCKCICPPIAAIYNPTDPLHNIQNFHIVNVPRNKCNCEDALVPKLGEQFRNRAPEICPRCECKYESRNVTIMKVVVIIVIWVISILVIYMAFLIILDPLLNKRVKGSYQEHTNEEDETAAGVSGPMSHNMSVRGNVLNRVGHQQDKWKRQVKEQRRNIYDRHTMLN